MGTHPYRASVQVGGCAPPRSKLRSALELALHHRHGQPPMLPPPPSPPPPPPSSSLHPPVPIYVRGMCTAPAKSRSRVPNWGAHHDVRSPTWVPLTETIWGWSVAKSLADWLDLNRRGGPACCCRHRHGSGGVFSESASSEFARPIPLDGSRPPGRDKCEARAGASMMGYGRLVTLSDAHVGQRPPI